jgi:hypothetical protein
MRKSSNALTWQNSRTPRAACAWCAARHRNPRIGLLERFRQLQENAHARTGLNLSMVVIHEARLDRFRSIACSSTRRRLQPLVGGGERRRTCLRPGGRTSVAKYIIKRGTPSARPEAHPVVRPLVSCRCKGAIGRGRNCRRTVRLPPPTPSDAPPKGGERGSAAGERF